jgi:anti-anti-sigma factor
MSVLQNGLHSGQGRVPEPRAHDIRRARVDAVASCSCAATALASPAGEVLVLRVAGEVDLLTIAVLQGALRNSLARGPCHLLVDLAELTFCSVRGLSLLVQAGRTAAGQGTGYSISAASAQSDHAWTLLWPVGELPSRHPTAAAGVAAALADAGPPRAGLHA